MTRLFWDKVSREFIPYDSLPPRPKPKGPIIIGDNIPDAGGRTVLNPADGKHYSSKARYYEAVKRAGGEVKGNEKPRPRPGYQAQGVGQDVKRAIEELKSR